jgi:sugar phosphate isomerase/epimerase
MDLFISTACLPGTEPLAARVRRFCDEGLSSIELGAGVEVPEGPLQLPTHPSSRFLLHNYFPAPPEPFVLNLASRDDAIRSKSLQLVRTALLLSQEIGAPFFSVHGGFVTDATGFGTSSFVFPSPSRPEEAQEAMDVYIDSLGQLLPLCEKTGVSLLVENNVCTEEHRGKLLLQNSTEFLEMFRRCSHPMLGALIDTGHLNVSATTFGFDRLNFIDDVEPFVRAVHLHDNEGKIDSHFAIEESSWTLAVLRRSSLRDISVILEAKFPEMKSLKAQAMSLRQWLNIG